MTLIVRVILKSAVTYIHILTSVSAPDRLFIHSYIIFNHMVRELRFFLNVVKAILTQGKHICKRKINDPLRVIVQYTILYLEFAVTLDLSSAREYFSYF